MSRHGKASCFIASITKLVICWLKNESIEFLNWIYAPDSPLMEQSQVALWRYSDSKCHDHRGNAIKEALFYGWSVGSSCWQAAAVCSIHQQAAKLHVTMKKKKNWPSSADIIYEKKYSSFCLRLQNKGYVPLCLSYCILSIRSEPVHLSHNCNS